MNYLHENVTPTSCRQYNPPPLLPKVGKSPWKSLFVRLFVYHDTLLQFFHWLPCKHPWFFFAHAVINFCVILHGTALRYVTLQCNAFCACAHATSYASKGIAVLECQQLTDLIGGDECECDAPSYRRISIKLFAVIVDTRIAPTRVNEKNRDALNVCCDLHSIICTSNPPCSHLITHCTTSLCFVADLLFVFVRMGLLW